ncbi:hypothetical protein OAM52_05300 [Flavobacteriaceae bacterium]|nr:hypothetical protein [Flavobacteriaceae bacterium]
MTHKEKLIEFEKNLDNLGIDFVKFITTEQVFSKIRENIINSIKTELVKYDLNYDNPGLGFEKYYLGDSSSPLLKIIIRRTPEGKFLKTDSSINVEFSIQKFKLKKKLFGVKKNHYDGYLNFNLLGFINWIQNKYRIFGDDDEYEGYPDNLLKDIWFSYYLENENKLNLNSSLLIDLNKIIFSFINEMNKIISDFSNK